MNLEIIGWCLLALIFVVFIVTSWCLSRCDSSRSERLIVKELTPVPQHRIPWILCHNISFNHQMCFAKSIYTVCEWDCDFTVCFWWKDDNFTIWFNHKWTWSNPRFSTANQSVPLVIKVVRLTVVRLTSNERAAFDLKTGCAVCETHTAFGNSDFTESISIQRKERFFMSIFLDPFTSRSTSKEQDEHL